MVLRAFPPAGAWRPTVAAHLARTLDATNAPSARDNHAPLWSLWGSAAGDDGFIVPKQVPRASLVLYTYQLGFRIRNLQPQMLHEGRKVLVRMQKPQTVLNAVGGNERGAAANNEQRGMRASSSCSASRASAVS